jgi:hypothetical protein
MGAQIGVEHLMVVVGNPMGARTDSGEHVDSNLVWQAGARVHTELGGGGLSSAALAQRWRCHHRMAHCRLCTSVCASSDFGA